MPPEYHLESFWTRRFQHEQHFEWLGDGQDTIIPLLREYLVAERDGRTSLPHRLPRTLHIGAGTSTLSEHILNAYRETEGEGEPLPKDTIVNTDFSEKAVLHGSMAAGMGGVVKWAAVDMLSWKDIAEKLIYFEGKEDGGGSGFSVVIDKSTSDAISCAPDVPLDVACAQALDRCPAMIGHLDLSEINTVESLELLALHLAALVPPRGIWIALSYSSNRFPFLTIPTAMQRGRSAVFWSIKRIIPVDAPSGQAKEGVHAPTVQHFVYVLERSQAE